MKSWILLLLPVFCFGQEIYVRSEFQRPAQDGQVLPIDRMNQKGREILSPPVLRNAFSSFHVTLEAPAGTPVTVYIGLNPDNALKPTLYLEKHLPNGEPQDLEEVKLPYSAKIPTQGALNFLLDLWVAPDAKVERVKVEPQMWIPDRWITYPMEVRVLEAVVPKYTLSSLKLPESEARADRIAYPRMREFLCQAVSSPAEKLARPNVLSLMDRNVAQDIALAGKLPREQALQGLLGPTGISTAEAWCDSTKSGPLESLPTEWFLRVRDFLYRVAVN